MRIIEARGPVVNQLKRYDPGLRIRWSWEKKKWAVEAPVRRQDKLVPPVFYEPVGEGEWIEHILPELSERYITYQEKMYVICWTKNLDTRLVDAVVKRDSNRISGNYLASIDRKIIDYYGKKKVDEAKRTDERCREAWDLMKYYARKNPTAEDGTGVSIKGLGLED